MRMLRDSFLYLSKWFGLFAISRRLTRRGLRILCYHGFAVGDETRFRPALFITPSTFRRRLAALRTKRYPVMSLDAALAALDAGELADCATVITIDDGFYGFYQHAVGALREYQVPATVYVMTYHSLKQTPVFGLVIQYMVWKTTKASLNLADLSSSLSGTVSLTGPRAKDDVTSEIIRVGETSASEAERVALATRLGELLDVDFETIRATRILSLMTAGEVQAVVRDGIDVQLHTHRHRLPPVKEQTAKEISDNRAVLEPLVGKRLDHLCYPSGVWSPELWPWLISAGIKSATTCDFGLNYHDTPRLGLRRILDAEDVSQINFEAEMAGYKDLLRGASAILTRVVGGRPRI